MDVPVSIARSTTEWEPNTTAPQDLTLLDLVRAVSEVTSEEDEVVATVVHLIRSGRVRLRGIFRDAPVEQF